MPLPIFDMPIQRFLRPAIIDTTYIYIDRWSGIHFLTGLILGFFFAHYYHKQRAWLVVLIILTIYEIFEVLLNNILFVPETIKDKVWDLIIGQLGFFISYLILKNKAL